MSTFQQLTLFVISICTVGAAAQDPPKPTLTLTYTTVRLSPVKGASAGTLVIQAKDFAGEVIEKSKPGVQVLGQDGQYQIVLSEKDMVLVAKTESGAVWRQPFTVSGWLPQSAGKCNIVVTLANTQTPFEVTLTDKPETAIRWDWKAAPSWHVIDSKALPLAYGVTDGSVSGVRLVQASLERKGDPKLALNQDSFRLCANAVEVKKQGGSYESCEKPAGAQSASLSTVYLRFAANKEVPPGEYEGNLLLARDQDSEGKPLAVKLYVTSWGLRCAGVAALGAGWFLYFLAAVLGRWRTARAERIRVALLLAMEARRLIARAESILKGAPPKVLEAVTNKVEDIEGELSEGTIELPPISDPAGKLKEFQSRMDGQTKRVTALEIVIDRGMPGISEAARLAGSDPVKLEKVAKAGGELVHLADDDQTRAKLLEEIARIITKLLTDIGEAPKGGAAAAQGVVPQLQRIEFAIATWSLISIFTWLILSVITGSLAMIATKPGFGTEVDLALCLLWGAGLPIAGKGLSDLTASGVPAAFGLTIPKIT